MFEGGRGEGRGEEGSGGRPPPPRVWRLFVGREERDGKGAGEARGIEEERGDGRQEGGRKDARERRGRKKEVGGR
jgi:hypothetical protein